MYRQLFRIAFSSLLTLAIACGSGNGDGGTDSGQSDVATDPGPAEDPGPPSDPGGQADPGTLDTPADIGGVYHPVEWTNKTSPGFHGPAANQGLGACTSCHGADLAGGTVKVSCDKCHGGWQTNCTFCHGGTDNDLGAPPVSTSGKTAVTDVDVGAHTAHLSAAAGISSPLDCSDCHVVPTDVLTPGHVDPSPAEVTGHGWNHDTATCSSAWCHGVSQPLWTSDDGTQAACGTCHDLPPKTGKHPNNFGKHAYLGTDCTKCHEGIANGGATQILDPTKHVDGNHDVKIQNGTWNAATKTCNPACHGSEKW